MTQKPQPVTMPDGRRVDPAELPTLQARLLPEPPVELTGTVGQRIEPVALPPAVGGIAPYCYTVIGLPPGLYFDPTTRVVAGTPEFTGHWHVEYVASIAPDGPSRPDDILVAFKVVIFASRLAEMVHLTGGTGTAAELSALSKVLELVAEQRGTALGLHEAAYRAIRDGCKLTDLPQYLERWWQDVAPDPLVEAGAGIADRFRAESERFVDVTVVLQAHEQLFDSAVRKLAALVAAEHGPGQPSLRAAISEMASTERWGYGKLAVTEAVYVAIKEGLSPPLALALVRRVVLMSTTGTYSFRLRYHIGDEGLADYIRWLIQMLREYRLQSPALASSEGAE